MFFFYLFFLNKTKSHVIFLLNKIQEINNQIKSSGIKRAAMQAVIKQTIAPPMNALKISLVTASLLFGHKVLIQERTIPTEPGFEKPQIA